MPSGISWKAITSARDKPTSADAEKPEPIANPSGKLWIAKPIPTKITVLIKALSKMVLDFLFIVEVCLENLLITFYRLKTFIFNLFVLKF